MSWTDAPPPGPASPKRLQIIEAAAGLFMAQGYGDVSTDAIARAAGVSKATLYAYFPSKEALFATIIGEACTAQQQGAPTCVPDPSVPPRDALVAIGGQLLRFLLRPERLAMYRVVIAESVRFPELGHVFFENGPRRLQRCLADWLAAQMEAGRLRRADPALAADQLIALLQGGIFLRAVLGLDGLDTPGSEADGSAAAREIDEAVQAAADTFLSAFAPPPAAG